MNMEEIMIQLRGIEKTLRDTAATFQRYVTNTNAILKQKDDLIESQDKLINAMREQIDLLKQQVSLYSGDCDEQVMKH